MSNTSNKFFPELGLEFMVVGRKVLVRPTDKNDSVFKPISRKKLRDKYRSNSPVWEWLRTHKIYRPSYNNVLVDKKSVNVALTTEDERFLEFLKYKGGFQTHGEVVSYALMYSSVFSIEVIAPLVIEAVRGYGSIRRAIVFLNEKSGRLNNQTPLSWVASGGNIREILEILESKKKL